MPCKTVASRPACREAGRASAPRSGYGDRILDLFDPPTSDERSMGSSATEGSSFVEGGGSVATDGDGAQPLGWGRIYCQPSFGRSRVGIRPHRAGRVGDHSSFAAETAGGGREGSPACDRNPRAGSVRRLVDHHTRENLVRYRVVCRQSRSGDGGAFSHPRQAHFVATSTRRTPPERASTRGGALQDLIEDIAAHGATDSPLETRFLQLLRRSRLPAPRRQYEIHDEGTFIARVDFAYPEIRLAVEVDGYRFHSSRPSCVGTTGG